MYIGCHLSASKGYSAMAQTAYSIGANTFQFFTRNPRGAGAKPIDEDDAANAMRFMSQKSFGKLVAHAPYTLNLCSKNEDTRKFALETFKDDMKRMEYTPNNFYNFHPGSHVGQGTEKGIEFIISALDEILFPEMTTTVLLETMAGKGSEVGSTFEELREIIDGVKLKDKLGVCLDTCHVYDAGYDIREKPQKVLEEFDRVIGLERLKAVHLNDSKFGLSSHKDRHEKIGQGKLGLDAIVTFITLPEIRELPIGLETPNDLDGYKSEIALLRRETS